MQDLEAGDPTTVGPYTLRARLGEGGMGRVFLAHSPSGRLTAVKLIRPELAGDGVFRDRFRREVTAARMVSGAFTAPVVDADPDATTPWLATQYVPGPSLHEAVAQAGPFAPEVLRRLGAGILEALVAVHRVGLVHRDLKPSNVLLATDGPRLIDFGIARAADHTELTRSGDIVGTAAYMSPEQANGAEAGPASDVFAVGAVLVFAATGRGPFGRGTPAAVLYRVVHGEPDLAGVPADLHGTLRSCLAKDPDERPEPAALLGWFAGGVQVAGPSWPQAVTRLLDLRAAEVNGRLHAPRPTAVLPPTRLPPHPAASPSRPAPPQPTPFPPTPFPPAPAPPTPTPPGRLSGSPVTGPPGTPPPSPGPRSDPSRTPLSQPEDPQASGPRGGPQRPYPVATVFSGRWRMCLAVGLVLAVGGTVLTVSSAVALAGALRDLADSPAGDTSAMDRIIGCSLFLVAGLLALPAGWWRLRYALRRPTLTVGPLGLRAEVDGNQIDLGWRHIARAEVVAVGRREILAVWPAVPGMSWAVRGRRARRRPRGRHRCLWHNFALGCDMIMDMSLLDGSPTQEVTAALSAIPHLPPLPGPPFPPPPSFGDHRRRW
ncbi:serine/threonine-protein kinase [Frankia sp. AgB32]|uniref:serine/threonine-protein kinase n=1 Tax=Frankia sp. AgB32 TaxID=631119 RepID=UPI00200DB8DC|nr:serine/threonine-protein kinase [Frankia sp. AgB32]MCK9896995.1 serine/threonine protein kinase [Frankia sp. AgB32]